MVNLSLPPPSYSPSDSLYSSYPNGSPTILPESHLDHNMNNSSTGSSAPVSPGIHGESSSPSLMKSSPTGLSSTFPAGENVLKESNVGKEGMLNNGLSDSTDEIMKRVLEMNKIIADAESYLNEAESSPSGSIDKRMIDPDEETSDPCDHHPQLKAADSLLFLTHIEDIPNNRDKIPECVDDSPCESDTDVESLITINGSLSHVQSSKPTCLYDESKEMDGFEYNQHKNSNINNKLAKNYLNDNIEALNNNNNNNNNNSNNVNTNKVTIPIPAAGTGLGGSSFGLHSPDVIPSLSDTENDLIETLKALQNPGEYQIPFSDTNLYLDHDIIDLTAIPPPKTPDSDSSPSLSIKSSKLSSSSSPYAIPYLQSTLHQNHYSSVSSSPTPYCSYTSNEKNILSKTSLINNNNNVDRLQNNRNSYQENGYDEMDAATGHPSNGQIYSELDKICDDLKDISLVSNFSPLSLLRSASVSLPASPIDMEILKSLPQDIDKFIATVTVPPPTTTTTATATTPPPSSNVFSIGLDEANYDNGYESNKDDCDYLSSLIIPPPPTSSPSFNQEQDEIIARFWKATDAVRKVCNEGDERPSPLLTNRENENNPNGDLGSI